MMNMLTSMISTLCEQIEDIPIQEEGQDEVQHAPPCPTKPPSSTDEASLAYQFEMMNTWFDAIEEMIAHFMLRISNIGNNISQV